MAFEVQIVKSTTTGESVIVKGTIEDPSEWATKVKPLFDMVDARMAEQNRRYQEALKCERYFPKEYRTAFRQIIDAFYGHMQEAIPGNIVVPRNHQWDEGEPEVANLLDAPQGNA